jgi:hypothetical protein
MSGKTIIEFILGGLKNGEEGSEPSKDTEEKGEYGFGNKKIEISCSA